MTRELTIRNRQKVRRVNTRYLRQLVTAVLERWLDIESVELGVTLVAAPRMARLNWQFLQHEGPTDVITFDHTEAQISRRKSTGRKQTVCGELFICVDVAVTQARTFRTSWPAELVRYIVHGILHLLGYDDHQVAKRRHMKREENRLMRRLAAEFNLAELSRHRRRL